MPRRSLQLECFVPGGGTLYGGPTGEQCTESAPVKGAEDDADT